MFMTSNISWAIAGIFAWGAIFVTGYAASFTHASSLDHLSVTPTHRHNTTLLSRHLIVGHLKNYSKPSQQLWIVRILFMVPVYSFSSWLSLKFIHYSLFFDVVRDCYEGRFFFGIRFHSRPYLSFRHISCDSNVN